MSIHEVMYPWKTNAHYNIIKTTLESNRKLKGIVCCLRKQGAVL